MSSSEQFDQHVVNEFVWSSIWNENERWITDVLRNRLHNSDEVDEVVQEIRLGLIKSGTTPADVENPSAWLYRIAVRQVLMYRRKKGRYQKLLESEQTRKKNDIEVSSNPLALLMRTERVAKIREVMQQLNELDREVLMLKYSENWTYKQLAEKLGVSVNAVEHRLVKAKKRLRNFMTTENGEVAV